MISFPKRGRFPQVMNYDDKDGKNGCSAHSFFKNRIMAPKKRGRESKKEASSKQPKLSKTKAIIPTKARQPRLQAPPKVCQLRMLAN